MIKSCSVLGLELKYRHFENQGKAKLVFIHGYGGSPADWHSLSEVFKDNYDIILLDLRTFFTQIKPIRFSQQVIYLKHWLEKVLGEEKFSLIGMSYGGALTLALRQTQPALDIQNHILINPMPFSPVSSLKHVDLLLVLRLCRIPGFLKYFSMTPWGKKIFRSMAEVFHFGKKSHDLNVRKVRLIKKAMYRFLWIDKKEDWSRWKKRINDPLTKNFILYSENDQLFTKEQFIEMAELFSSFSIFSFKNMGHLVVRSNDPKFIETLKEILKYTDPT